MNLRSTPPWSSNSCARRTRSCVGSLPCCRLRPSRRPGLRTRRPSDPMGTEIIVALIGATSVVTVAVINSRQSKKTNRKLDAVAEDAAAARDQVQNTHKTNMRHDLDVIRDEMRDGFARL